MRYFKPDDFTGNRAWDALDIAKMDGTTVRLHWTDKPYKWHINDGQEVFVVLQGRVDMQVREANGKVTVTQMSDGMIAHATEGTEHVAHPQGAARILVIEKEGSV